MDWQSRRTEQVGDIWDKEFGNEKDRVVTVLGSQAANPWVTEQLMKKVQAYDPNFTVDAVGIAPYVGFNVSPQQEAEVESWTKQSDGGLAKVFDYLNKTALPKTLEHITNNKEITDKYGVNLVAYEGGQHLVGIKGVENNEAIMKMFINANRDPRMGETYGKYLESWDKLTDGSAFVNFSDIGTPNKWGSWGALEHLYQPTSSKWEALQDFIETHSNPSTTPLPIKDAKATDGNDELNGTNNNDILNGKGGNDSLRGKQGNDILNGGKGDDTLVGGEGFDVLIGGSGKDRLWGGQGNDYLIGGEGEDRLSGGKGRDRFVYNSLKEGGDTIVDFDPTQDTIDLRRIFNNRCMTTHRNDSPNTLN